jgi:hypothetical protein
MYKLQSHCSSALALLAIICISTAASLAQTPKESIDPFAVLPASDALIVIDLNRFTSDAIPRLLVDDPDARALVLGTTDPKTIDLLDPRAIQRFVAGLHYTTPPNEKTPTDFVIVTIAQTTEAGQLPALIRSRGSGKYREQQYGGKTLFITKEEQPGQASQATMATGSDEWAIVALDANTLVFGDPTYVRSSVDITTGKGKTVSAELVTAAKRNPNALFSAAGALPPLSVFGAQQFTNTDLGHMLSSLKRFDSSVELIPTGWQITLTLTTTTPEQTKSLVDVLGALKTLMVNVGPTKTKQERVARDVIKGVVISSVGSEVQIKHEIPQASVNELAKQYGARMYFNQGVAHGLKGEPDAAISDYEKSIRLDSENASVFINRGKARATKGDLDQAIVDYDKAISMDPDDALAYNNRCFAQDKKGNFDAAIADCTRAIALEPTFAYA